MIMFGNTINLINMIKSLNNHWLFDHLPSLSTVMLRTEVFVQQLCVQCVHAVFLSLYLFVNLSWIIYCILFVLGSWGKETQYYIEIVITMLRRFLSSQPRHHALSPPPSHHHLYIIHLINWLQRFCRITMSLKRPFVPKSDVKQWFTTTRS